MTQVKDEFLSIKEVCELLKISRATYNNHREQPWFPERVFTVGARPRYRSSEIAEVPERRARYQASLSEGDNRILGATRRPSDGGVTVPVPLCSGAAASGKHKREAGKAKPIPAPKLVASGVAVGQHFSDQFPNLKAMERLRDRIRAAVQEMPRPEPPPHVVLRVRDMIVRNASSGKLTMLDEVVDALRMRNSNPAYRRYVEDTLVLVSKSSAETSRLMLGLMVSPEKDPYSYLESQADLGPDLKIDLSTMRLVLDHRRRIFDEFEQGASAEASDGKLTGKAPRSGS